MNTFSSEAPIVLVDGLYYLHRAYHALPPLKTSSGQQTGAVKGVYSMLNRLQDDYPGSPVIVVRDPPGKTFRHELYEEYKSNRKRMDDELHCQIDPLFELVEAMGMPVISTAGVEGDDIIGTLSVQLCALDKTIIISSADKDLAQLVNEQVSLVDNMKKPPLVLNQEGVKEKFGVPPELIVDYLALRGDSSDNIPGVPGVGEKSATQLIEALGSLENIYADLDQVKNLPVRGAASLTKKLLENKDKADLSWQLAKIKTDVELDFELSQLLTKTADLDRLRELLTGFEFRTELFRLEQISQRQSSSVVTAPSGKSVADVGSQSLKSEEELPIGPVTETDWELVLTQADFTRWIEKMTSASLVSIDTETTSLDFMEARVVGISVAVETGQAAYIPFGHNYPGVPQQLSEKRVLAQLKPLLEDENLPKVGQNLKYDSNVLANHGIELRGIVHDTMLASYILDSGLNRHDLDYLAQRHMQRKVISFSEVAGKGSKQLTFDRVPLEFAAPYAAEDADVALQLCGIFTSQLQQQPKLDNLFTDVEMKLLPVLTRMERRGVKIDDAALKIQQLELDRGLVSVKQKIWTAAGYEFNISSPRQLGQVMFEEMGLRVLEKTPKGEPSTRDSVLNRLSYEGCEFADLILNYRHLDKLKSTYVDVLPKQVNAHTGRIHSSWRQAAAATGRLASSGPNLQNIPVRSEEGRRIRKVFIAEPEHCLVCADYSQIELRIMAHFSEDSGLIDAFQQGKDIHRQTAAEIFRVSTDQVTDEQRRNAKAINFGLIYGMSAFGLARRLNISQAEARGYIDVYFERYPGVKKYMEGIRDRLKQQGYVETLFGRRLHFHSGSRSGAAARAAERAAINAPMQGTAADIIKRAMLEIDRHLHLNYQTAVIIMQVHDELVFEVSETEADRLMADVEQLMSAADAGQLAVPLTVSVMRGSNWEQAH